MVGMVLGAGNSINDVIHIVISTWIISISKVSISLETKELFVHADHLFYLGIKCIVSLTINYFVPQGNRFEFRAFFGDVRSYWNASSNSNDPGCYN